MTLINALRIVTLQVIAAWEETETRQKISQTRQRRCQGQDREDVKDKTGKMSRTRQGRCQGQDREDVKDKTGKISQTRHIRCHKQDTVDVTDNNHQRNKRR
ncbi:hypothetical protein BgiBS90_003757 [Biomphalaria glabrata]|nr:hypothetical protein BgiBS90_003757 [Biomphalaria glabrata]